MTSHKCGNCFFFQEAGFAGSGWCLNADRAQSSDVRSLVRRNELACRNDWGASLWADPKTAAETGAVLKRIDLEAERPATASEISSVVGIREPAPRNIQEDRITVPSSEDRVASAAARPARPGDEWFGTGPSNGTYPSAPTATRPQQSRDSMDGEDLVVGDIRVRDMGDTGRRPLVDQIPADIQPRRGPAEPVVPSVADASLPEPRPIRAIRPVPTLSTTRNDVFDGAADLDVHAPVIEGLRTRNMMDRSSSDGPAPAPDNSSPRPADALRRSGPTGRPATTDPTSGDAGTSSEERPTRATTRANPIAPHLPAGVTPAPVPEPVPAREMTRRDTRSTSGNARPVIPRPTSPQPERPAASSSARPVMATALPDHPNHLTERPPYRRPATLPELPQERFDARLGDSTPLSDSDAAHPVMAPRLDRSAGTRQDRTASSPQHRSERPAPMDEPERATPRRSAGRPPLPGGQRRPTPPAARTIPTVGEVRASRDGSRPGDHGQRAPERTAPERQARAPIPDRRRNGRPMSDESVREDRAPWDDEPTATFADRPSVDQLLPPVQLRPELADYGDYGDWMKLDPVMPRLAPDLARRCETCRDFRPAADGERGWCANKDAFTVRKVVYADELPCMNSFGCWWVPYDDIWLSEASVREHRNPTPLLDQLMPELNDWTREDRRRGS